MAKKQCTRCGVTKDLNRGFKRHSNSSDGHYHICKRCLASAMSLGWQKLYKENRPNPAHKIVKSEVEQIKETPLPMPLPQSQPQPPAPGDKLIVELVSSLTNTINLLTKALAA